jgi:hypothetical protein
VNINLLRRTYVRGVTEYAIGIATNKLSADIFLEFSQNMFVYNASQPLALRVCISELVLVCTLQVFRTPVHVRLRGTVNYRG